MKKLTALVTGGNKGIGEQIALQLAQTGKFNVLLTARNEELGRKTAGEIQKVGAEKSQITFYTLDVSSDDSVKNLSKSLEKDGIQELDVLINNAGWASKGSNLDRSIAENTMNTNFYGVIRVTSALLPLIKKSAKPKIITVASQAGQVSSIMSNHNQAYKIAEFTDEKVKNYSLKDIEQLVEDFIESVDKNQIKENGWISNGYSISKMAVNAYMRILARDLANAEDTKNITVASCCPGWCKSDMAGWEKPPRTTAEGAQVAVFLATNDVETGKFWYNNKAIPF